MQHRATSIQTFIGALDYDASRSFYRELGFEELILSEKMSNFRVTEHLGFYLQDYYVKDWVNNSMIFLEVDSVDRYWEELQKTGLDQKYKNVRFTPIKHYDWGKECFMHDPSGVLWHFGEFY